MLLPEPGPSSARGAAFTHSSTKGHRNHDSAIEGSLYASSSNNRHISHSWCSRQNTSWRISKDLFFRLSSVKLTFKFSEIQNLLRKMSVKKKAALVISWQKSFSIMAPWRKGKVLFFSPHKVLKPFVSQLFLFFKGFWILRSRCVSYCSIKLKADVSFVFVCGTCATTSKLSVCNHLIIR